MGCKRALHCEQTRVRAPAFVAALFEEFAFSFSRKVRFAQYCCLAFRRDRAAGATNRVVAVAWRAMETLPLQPPPR
jgi:hypothetical protein